MARETAAIWPPLQLILTPMHTLVFDGFPQPIDLRKSNNRVHAFQSVGIVQVLKVIRG